MRYSTEPQTINKLKSRIKVPFGWLVSHRETYSGHEERSVAVAMVFIFDPFYTWKLED